MISWGYIKKCGLQIEGEDPPTQLYPSETTSGILCPVLGSPFRKDRDLLEQAHRRATEMTRGLKHLPYEERLRDLRLFSLRWDLITVYI